MSIAKQLEEQMWEAALRRDSETFSRIVSTDAVMICGGVRCTGVEYAALIKEYGISEYQLLEFETVYKTDSLIQTHSVVRTVADCEQNADLAGLFHVTSTWQLKNGAWQLIFNMDQRIMS